MITIMLCNGRKESGEDGSLQNSLNISVKLISNKSLKV